MNPPTRRKPEAWEVTGRDGGYPTFVETGLLLAVP
jgi:hypothetical protein